MLTLLFDNQNEITRSKRNTVTTAWISKLRTEQMHLGTRSYKPTTKTSNCRYGSANRRLVNNNRPIIIHKYVCVCRLNFDGETYA